MSRSTGPLRNLNDDPRATTFSQRNRDSDVIQFGRDRIRDGGKTIRDANGLERQDGNGGLVVQPVGGVRCLPWLLHEALGRHRCNRSAGRDRATFKPEPAAVDGLDVFLGCPIVVHSTARRLDHRGNCRIGHDEPVPDLLDEFVLGDQPVGIGDEITEHRECPRFDGNHVLPEGQLTAIKIQRERIEDILHPPLSRKLKHSTRKTQSAIKHRNGRDSIRQSVTAAQNRPRGSRDERPQLQLEL